MTSLFRSVALAFLVLSVAGRSSGQANELNHQTQASSSPGTVNVNVTLDALTNRHPISSYVYGGAYPQDASDDHR